MKILAFLQNQWFRDPDKIRKMIAEAGDAQRQKELRRRLTKWALFAGCKTGRVLNRCLGEDLCERMIWEESSKDIGGHSSASFPADLAHIAECYEEFQPEIVVGFGRTAGDALVALREEYQIPTKVVFLSAPHPAARHQGVEAEIRLVAHQIAGLEFRAQAPAEVEF